MRAARITVAGAATTRSGVQGNLQPSFGQGTVPTSGKTPVAFPVQQVRATRFIIPNSTITRI